MEIIQPKIQQNITTAFKGKLLTCAYCRVSTSSELQLNSYDAQVKHYTELIQNNAEWEFVGIYSDEGMSGTSVKKRAGFMKMIADAKNGKMNLIICKSISRFGRNTTDILNYIRLLKKYNVAVFFENENINTLTAIGEVLITILASLAQDGSRQISENVNWGIDKAFKNGKVFGNNKALGYEIKDGEIVIIEEEAKIVRLIFDNYLNGDGAVKIAKTLDKMKIPTPLKSKRWNATTILNMLKNERYAGHLLQQKYYTVDYLSHKRLKNKGEVRQYLFRNNHPAIIEPAKWDLVQLEIKRRRTMQNNETGRATKHSNKYCWSGKLQCGKCGNGFRRVVWHKKHVAWQCQGYALYGKKHCDVGSTKEEVLMTLVKFVYDKLKETDKSFIFDTITILKETIQEKDNSQDLKTLSRKIDDLNQELKVLRDMRRKELISEDEFIIDYTEIQQEINEYIEKKNLLDANILDTNSQISRIEKLIETLNNDEFNEDFVRNCINKIVITKDIYKVYLNDLETCLLVKPDELSAFIYPTQDVLLNRYKCNLSHLFSKYSNLKENYSDITVELYIAV